MSDRIDTEAVRRDLRAGEHRGMGTILALCDELDRTREALREIASGRWLTGTAIDLARAALAEGDTARPERCPTCGSDNPSAMPMIDIGPHSASCPNSWHRATDTETERLRREVEDGRLAFFGAMQTAIATNSDLNAKAIGYAIKNEGLRTALDEAVQLVADALHGSLPQDEWNQRALVLIQEAAGAISGSQDTTTGDAT